MIEVQFNGYQGFIQALKTWMGGKQSSFQRGLLKAGLLIQAEAQKLTPVDTGALRASAHTALIQAGYFRYDVTVRFTQHYAIYVHENLFAYHPVGQAKFLETAYNVYYQDALALLKAEMKR